MQVLQYPSDLSDQKYGGHAVMITIIEYERNASGGNASVGNAPVSSNTPNVNGGSSFFTFNYTEKPVSAIKLHIPSSVTATTEVSWDREEFGLVGSFAKFLGSKGLFKGGDSAYESTVKLLDNAGEFAGELKDHMISKVAKHIGQLMSFTGVPAYDLYMKAGRQAINPHTELIFRGITPRTFPMNYTFRPKNQQEAQAIDNIIRTLKRNMSPGISGDSGESYGRFYEYPNEFDIEFLFNDAQNRYITKLARCILQSCQVNYGSSGMFNTFADGFPTEIEMSLLFSETKVITREMVDKGF